MVYYILLYCYALSASFFQLVSKKKIPSLLILFFLGSVVVLAWRGLHGVDTENYLAFFADVGQKEEVNHGLDIGFLYLSSIIKWIKDDEVFYFFFIAVVSVGLKIRAISKISPLPIVSAIILLGTYFLSLEANQIRQALALGVCLLSFYYVIERNKWMFFSLIFLAATFHISAVIVLPVWWLFKIQISRKILLTLVLVSFLFVLISLEEILQYVVKYTFFWGEFIFSKIMNYASKMERVGFSPIQLWYIFISVIFINEKNRINNSTYNFLLNMFVIGVAMNFLLNSFSYMIRITYYFLAIEGILMAFLFYNSKLVNRIVLFLLAILMLTLKNYKYYIANLEFFQ